MSEKNGSVLHLKKIYLGTSLAVKWLRFRTPTAGGIGSTLSWGNKTPHDLWHGPKNNLFNITFEKRQLASHICVCLHSIRIHWFDWSAWRKFSLRLKKKLGKESSLFRAFSDNCGYSSLILHWHSECGGFLKVSCNVESQMIPVCFLCSITWEPTDLSCALKRSFIHMWFCKSRVGLSKHICSLSRSGDRWHILLYNVKKKV